MTLRRAVAATEQGTLELRSSRTIRFSSCSSCLRGYLFALDSRERRGDETMSGYVFDMASLLGRWLHLITGIAWIGASFYFVWLDNHLLAPARKDLIDAGVGGEVWAMHGGGFYNAQKYELAPATVPESLHWFYWEAYWTWLSGMFLLCLLYFAKAELYLIDPGVAPLSKSAAIAI